MSKKWTVIVRTQGNNLELELNNTLNSLIAQTYENLSVLITIHSDKEQVIKKTLAFLKPYQKMIDIKPIIVKDKQGNRSHPLNVALKNLDCEYLSFLDDDDIYYSNMGTTLIKALEDNNKTFALGRGINVKQRIEKDITGKEYLYTVSKAKRPYQEYSKPLLLLENFIPFNTFILKSSLLNNVKFNEDMEFLEDWDFLKQLILKEEFSIIQLGDVPVSEYRRRYDNTDTYNEDNHQKWLESRDITDNLLKDKETTIKIGDLKHIRYFYANDFAKEFEKQRIEREKKYEEERVAKEKEFEEYRIAMETEISKISRNTGYRIWNAAINNKILKNTVVKLVRYIRGLITK